MNIYLLNFLYFIVCWLLDTSATINDTTVDNYSGKRRYRNSMFLRRSSLGTKFNDNKNYLNRSKHTHLPTLVLDTEYPGLTQVKKLITAC